MVSTVKRQFGWVLIATAASMAWVRPAQAQPESRLYAGGLLGIATLSADATASTQSGRANVSLYKPENGPTLNVFAGVDAGRFLTVQANYIWNRNDVTLFSSSAGAGGGGFFQQPRIASQHAAIVEALVYFRARGDRVRPYLSTGTGLMRFESEVMPGMNSGLSGPEDDIASTEPVLRVAVGIDVAMRAGWAFRYSFSETISANPIGVQLMPMGQRNLANFQNLFGIVGRL